MSFAAQDFRRRVVEALALDGDRAMDAVARIAALQAKVTAFEEALAKIAKGGCFYFNQYGDTTCLAQYVSSDEACDPCIAARTLYCAADKTVR